MGTKVTHQPISGKSLLTSIKLGGFFLFSNCLFIKLSVIDKEAIECLEFGEAYDTDNTTQVLGSDTLVERIDDDNVEIQVTYIY